MKNKTMVILIGVLLVGAFVLYFIPTNKAEGLQYPDGIYCIPKQGLAYFDSSQVVPGAILIKSNPDLSNGEYTKRLDVNFLEMMGCIK